ncbi:hypothetical protein EYF80_019434 [Liparis tanakae]|uniref:Uncharacterized protein n=1 Tax=Liparis tanakae TaxID=230148 RepID=A0A4Z2HXM2_9TELE|nr:hypothetical protein EYF80_019434 [Liparis tanakae]
MEICLRKTNLNCSSGGVIELQTEALGLSAVHWSLPVDTLESDLKEFLLMLDFTVLQSTSILPSSLLLKNFQSNDVRGGYEQEGEKEVLMRSCTDLCWKLSGRPPPAMPPPALPPSVGSSDPPQCAGDSSGQHLNIWRQGERMRVDGAQEVYSATPSSCAARTTPHPNTLPPCTTRTSRSHELQDTIHKQSGDKVHNQNLGDDQFELHGSKQEAGMRSGALANRATPEETDHHYLLGEGPVSCSQHGLLQWISDQLSIIQSYHSRGLRLYSVTELTSSSPVPLSCWLWFSEGAICSSPGPRIPSASKLPSLLASFIVLYSHLCPPLSSPATPSCCSRYKYHKERCSVEPSEPVY